MLPGLLAAAAAWNAALPDLQLGSVELGCLVGGFLSYKVGRGSCCACGSGCVCGGGAAGGCGSALIECVPAGCCSPRPALLTCRLTLPCLPPCFPPPACRQVALVLKIYADLKPQPLTEEQLLRQQRPMLVPVEDVKLDLWEIGRKKAAEAAAAEAAVAAGGAAAAQQPQQRQEQQQ